MKAGMSLSERKALRQRMRQDAIDRAEQLGKTFRCQSLAGDLDDPGHQACRGEDPGNSGCLCRCHDNPGAVVVSRSDERLPA